MPQSSILAIVILPFLLLSCHIAFSQSVPPPTHDGQASASGQTKTRAPDVSLLSLHTRPKLSLQNALKIAEAYIAKEHIDASSYWLLQAKFMLYGAETTADKDKTPGWYFWWVNDDGSLGDYIEIFVSMDGKAMRLPSM
jgi:hypothetical protein